MKEDQPYDSIPNFTVGMPVAIAVPFFPWFDLPKLDAAHDT